MSTTYSNTLPISYTIGGGGPAMAAPTSSVDHSALVKQAIRSANVPRRTSRRWRKSALTCRQDGCLLTLMGLWSTDCPPDSCLRRGWSPERHRSGSLLQASWLATRCKFQGIHWDVTLGAAIAPTYEARNITVNVPHIPSWRQMAKH